MNTVGKTVLECLLYTNRESATNTVHFLRNRMVIPMPKLSYWEILEGMYPLKFTQFPNFTKLSTAMVGISTREKR